MQDQSEKYVDVCTRVKANKAVKLGQFVYWGDVSPLKDGLAERLLQAIWGCLRGILWVCLGLVALAAALVVGAYYVASLPHEAPSGVLADMARIEEVR